MAYQFGDGFDLYAAPADSVLGYWDSGTPASFSLGTGRFTGSRCAVSSNIGAWLVKSSGANDAVHHIVVAYNQAAAISGSTLGMYLQLSDAATNQCCVVFRSDGAILLTSATPGGTVLDTYTGAVTANNTWFAFEVEVAINNTTGSWAVRKNGNTSNDRALGGLNTRPGANAYANKLTLGQQANVGGFSVDDLLWRSDAASVPFVGDIRCYTRMPVSDASTQFTKSPLTMFAQNSASTSGTNALTANNIRACAVVAPTTGQLASLSFNFGGALTGHAKMALYDATGVSAGPGALLASSAELTNPGIGVNAFTVTAGPTVTKGVTYWVALWSDASVSPLGNITGQTAIVALTYTTTFPSTMVGFTGPSGINGMGSNGMNVTPLNAYLVNEAQQDGTTSYAFDSTAGHADFYNIGTIASTPASVVAVTTRGLMQKSDAGARTAAVQIKSGGTTVASPTLTLTTSFLWTWRTDTVNPATGTAWTGAAVDAVTIGPVTVA